MLVVRFNKRIMNILYSFLNKKFMERSTKHGRGYSVRKFSEEVGIKEGTMLRLLNENTDVKAIELDNLKKLVKAFGLELLQVLDLDPGSE